MLFHVIHMHTAELCPAGNKELVKNIWGKVFSSAEEIGIKIIGSYVNAPLILCISSLKPTVLRRSRGSLPQCSRWEIPR